MSRDRDAGARIDALVRGADWALTGTNGANAAPDPGDGDFRSEPEAALESR
jgi:hypothetical protein